LTSEKAAFVEVIKNKTNVKSYAIIEIMVTRSYEELKLINKIKLYPSIANFILIDFLSNENCENINKKLASIAHRENHVIFSMLLS
jgi:histidinol-phosphate/aromatic aminotransferase/cobyric acid decarboxylase-like protein